jgi:hypothetical protein
MCESAPSLEYAPRRIVALMAAAPEYPAGDATEPGNSAAGGSSAPMPDGPSPDAFMRNLRTPMPLGRKIRLVVRNTAIKAKSRQSCCGHPGEPGC